jgi:hypothetical protein
MAEVIQITPLSSQPGVRRDGTSYDTNYYTDGQWVRFQRGKPRKMGGYRQVVNNVTAPVRATLTWSRQSLNALYSFSVSKIEMVLVDNNGIGSNIIDRTPAGFTPQDDYIWTIDTMFDDAAGSEKTLVLAHASRSMTNIDDPQDFDVYYGDSAGSGAFVTTGISVSGGVLAAGPYAFYYGTDGQVTWSNVNEPLNITTGDAGSDRVTGAKIVKGLSVKSGAGPACLLWSLDSLIRADYVGGQAVFRFSTVTGQSSILAQNSVIEYDGAYLWIGIDRFLIYDGGAVKELPNQMNLNWFFDNLNYNHRQKVWASKTPRYGEIEWFYPRGDATECTHSVIYNLREQTWYDRELPRSAGYYSQVFRYPVMSDSITTEVKTFEVTVSAGAFQEGDTITGPTGVGVIMRSLGSGPFDLYVHITYGVFLNTDAVTSGSGGVGTVTSVPADDELTSLFTHETGVDAVIGEDVLAIPAWIECADIGFTSGGVQGNDAGPGVNRQTRIIRLEPDFVLEGELTLTISGKRYAQSSVVVGEIHTFDGNTEKVDIREQFRQMYLKFESNEAGGDFQMGRVLVHVDPGDFRS